MSPSKVFFREFFGTFSELCFVNNFKMIVSENTVLGRIFFYLYNLDLVINERLFPLGEKDDISKFHTGRTKGQAIPLPSIFRRKVPSTESIYWDVFRIQSSFLNGNISDFSR